jgi:O-antigen ligase
MNNIIRLSKSCLVFLILFLFFLPLIEAPKNFALLAFFISTVVLFIKNKQNLFKWGFVDTIFLIWLVLLAIIGVNTEVNYNLSGTGSLHIVAMIFLGWGVSRINFNKIQTIYLLISIIFATILGVIYSYMSGCYYGNQCIELNSVGHINHTAIYLLLTYTILLSFIISSINKLTISKKILLITLLSLLALVIVDTNSRAAVGMMIFITILFFIFSLFWYRNNHIYRYLLVFVILISSITYYVNPPIINKFINGTGLLEEGTPRDKIRNLSLYSFIDKPLFGVGFKNFSTIKVDDIKDSVLKYNDHFDKNDYTNDHGHAHNLYYNYLVSGGFVVFIVMIIFWSYLVYIIYQLIKLKNSHSSWLALSALGIVIVNLGIGFVNTTFHHEHGMLSMVFLALLISKYRFNVISNQSK